MSRDLATLLYFAAIAWLFVLDRTRRPMTSSALWISIIWWAILATRPVSAWIYGQEAQYSSLEGSPLDANIFLLLMCIGTIVLYRRRVHFSSVFARNTALCMFMLYCLVSTAWSEYPAVSVKRWIKDCGNIVAILIIATESDPKAAIRAVLSRCTYLTIPTSVLAIKYWDDIGRYYDRWTWTPYYSGITLEKNSLGAIAMLSALFLLWDFLYCRATRMSAQTPTSPAAPNHRQRNTHVPYGAQDTELRRPKDIVYWGAQVAVFCMALWVLHMANSSNALVCFMLGAALILALGASARGRKRFIRHMGSYVVAGSLAGFILVSSSSFTDMVLGELGEDVTLTGRTDLWADVLSYSGFTLFGAGYQSFWLGSFAQILWAKYNFHPNQAHNGFIETYLNGGWIGLLLLLAFMATAASRLRSRLLLDDATANLLFAFLVVTFFYNISEAVFNRMSPIWLATLLAGVSYFETRAAMNANARVPKW